MSRRPTLCALTTISSGSETVPEKGKFSKGVDVASIARFKTLTSDVRFLRRVFTDSEVRASFNKRHPHRQLALRFAAKEACLKAFATGLAQGIHWKDIEVIEDVAGGQTLNLHGTALECLENRKIHLSTSCSTEYAVAVVIIERV